MKIVIDVLGWLGVVLLLSAYALVSSRKLAGDSPRYQFLNVAGGLLLILNSMYYGALPSVGVNIAWIGIAIFTLFSIRKQPN